MKKKIFVICGVLVILLSFFAGYQTANFFNQKSEPKVSTTVIREQLKGCSDLTTAQLTYRGLIRYEDGEIPWINKKSFSMVYSAKLEAGMDLAKASVSISGKKVKVTLPIVQLQSVEVQTDSIEFYDERSALFNWTEKEDTASAIELAKKDAEEHADVEGLQEKAVIQAQEVVKNLIEPLAEEYEVEVTVQE
ncbi:MAG: DUF4230 domain-containing protein [Lachnospiraceae bacterium]